MVATHFVGSGKLDNKWKIGERVYNTLYHYLLLYTSRNMYVHVMVNDSARGWDDDERMCMLLGW